MATEKISYAKTEDLNVFIRVKTIASNVYLSELEKQILDLEKQLVDASEPIEVGDYPKEVLELIEIHNTEMSNNVLWQDLLNDKYNLLSELKEL